MTTSPHQPDLTIYLDRFAAIDTSDPKRAHCEADQALWAFVYATTPEIAYAWNKVESDCGGWWYA